MIDRCELCDREKELTFHHLIPRTLHGNKYFKKNYDIKYLKSHGLDLCDECHHMIHDFFSEKELGKDYNEKEKILESEKVQKYLIWVKKQK